MTTFVFLAETIASILLWLIVVALVLIQLNPDERFSSTFYGEVRRHLPWIFVPVFMAALLAWRYESLVSPYFLNLDESQSIAEGLGYFKNWMPFSQDGNTTGPLNYYLVTWPKFLGLPITYLSVRLTTLACDLIIIWSTLRTLSYLLESRLILFVALPFLAFFVFARQSDFVHYSSEHLPATLLSVAFCLLVRIGLKRDLRGTFWMGLCLGADPFAKLQGAPVAVYLFLVAAILTYYFRGKDKKPGARSFLPLVSLIVGGSIVPLLILIPVIASGALPDAFHRYIYTPLHYNATVVYGKSIPTWLVVRKILHFGLQFTLYLAALMLLIWTPLRSLLYARTSQLTRAWWIETWLVLGYALVTSYVVLKPGLPFPHYLFFLIGPAMFVTAWFVRSSFLFCDENRVLFPFGWLVAIVVFCLLPIPLYAYYKWTQPYSDLPPEFTDTTVAAEINKLAQPGDTMAVWGYYPPYYVDTQLPPATHEFGTFYEQLPNPIYDYYREAYFRDLEAARPRIFVDAIGQYAFPSWPKPVTFNRHAAYGPIGDFVAANYTLVATMETAPSKPPVLIYVRNQ